MVEEEEEIKAGEIDLGWIADADALYAGDKSKRFRNWIGTHQHHFFPNPTEEVVAAQGRTDGITVRPEVKRDQYALG